MYRHCRTSFHGRVSGPGIRVCAGVFRTFVSIVADLRGAVVRSGLAACFRSGGDAVMVNRDLPVFQFRVQLIVGRLHRTAGIWRSDFRARVIESLAKAFLGMVPVKFHNAVHADHYRILFRVTIDFCDFIRRAHAGSSVAGTGTCQQRHQATQLVGWRRWLQPKSGSIDGIDGVLGGTVVRIVSDSGLPFDDAF